MAKNKVFIDIVIDDKGTTKRVAVNAKKLGLELDKAGNASEKAAKGQERVSKSSRDASRNMQGLSKRTSNSSKEFSKMSQGMGGLVGAYATLAAQIFAVSAAFQFLSEASQLRNLIAGQKALGAVTGTAFESISNSVIAATDGMLKFAEASRAVAIGTAAGLTSSQLTELGSAAKNASFALGRDLTDSFNRLIRGVTKAEPELLDELGIILRLEAATEKYGSRIGKAAGDLNAFERSQAVANEVLEQAERKFGAIEALMDPNASALARFTKSFDELINSFKLGLINELTPILVFLTKNTTALTAALALFALPIVKAILPNLNEWRKSSKELFDVYNDRSKQFEQNAQKQADSVKKVAQATEDANNKAKQAIAEQGGTGGRASLQYLSGERTDNRAKAAAKRVLESEKLEYDKHGKVITGTLKGYTRQQVQDLQNSFNKKEGIVTKFTKFFKVKFATMVPSAQSTFSKIQARFAGTMAAMSKAASRAALVINSALSLVGFLGTIALLVQVGKEVIDFLRGVDEAAKKQRETIENLTKSYKVLAKETQNAANARENLLVGTQSASNIGQVLQSIDIERKLLKDIETLGEIDDKTSDEYINLKANIDGVLESVEMLSPAFSNAREEFQLKGVIDETKDALLESDKAFREVAFTIDRLPEITQKARDSFTKLTGSLLKSTPLTQFVADQEKAVAGTQTAFDAAKAEFDKSDPANTAVQEANKKQAENDKKFLDDLDKLITTGASGQIRGDARRLRADFMEDPETVRAAEGIAVSGTMEAAAAEQLRLKNEENKKIQDEILKTLTEQTRVRDLFSKLETTLLGKQETRLKNELKSLKARTLGLTIEGRRANLEADRADTSNLVDKANDALLIQEEISKDIAANGASYTEIQKEQNKVSLANAKLNVEIANERQRQAQARIDLTLRELGLEESLLAIRNSILEKEREANQLRASADFTKAVTGGTFAGAQVARGMEEEALQASVDAARSSLDAAIAVYSNKVTEARDSLLADGTMSVAEATRRAQEQTFGGAEASQVRAAQDALIAAERKQFLEENAVNLLNNQTRASIETLGYQTDNLAISRERVLMEERVLALRKLGIEMTPEETEAARVLFKEQAELETSLKNQKQLGETLQSQMEGAFNAMIDGSKSAKQAFADMARAILADIAKMIVKQMVFNALQGMKIPGFAEGGITPSYAYGGMTPKRDYSTGGIARGPQSGYSATLHGNEAIVPLPNSRSIPVEFPQGGPGGNNNVTVNVTMNNDGTATSGVQGDTSMSTLGNAIAKAVQIELQNQKRAGGILSPYGAA